MNQTYVISMQSAEADDGTWQTACIISGLADQRQADAAESYLQSLLCGPQIGGLAEGDALITGAGDVDQRVSVAAPGAQEVAAGLIDLGLHSPEHDLKPAVSALPHGAPPGESYCGGELVSGTDVLAQDSLSVIVWTSDAICDVAAERRRQIATEGWEAEHDDEHTRGELVQAAADLCLDGTSFRVVDPTGDRMVGWGLTERHHDDRRRQLVIAGALILAEIERLDRAKS